MSSCVHPIRALTTIALVATAVALTGCPRGEQLRLRRVVLYQNGIGYFERTGTFDGDELRLSLRPHEADDALKTLTVIDRDDRGGRRRPLALSAVVPQPRPRVDDNAPDRERDVTLVVHLGESTPRRMLVAYAIPTPVWRAVYRVVLPGENDGGQGILQAWALVNNVSGEDWNDVDLTLATGAPFSYAVDLRTPRFVPRPDVTGRLVEPPVIGAVRSEQGRVSSGDDGDGVPQARDLCPHDAEDRDGFEDDDGCPDTDNDQDRIPDVDDECPDEPEVFNGVEDDDGCPDRGRVVIHTSNIIIMDQIYFAENSAELRERSQPILDAVAATLRGNPQIERVEIEGHAADNESDPWGLAEERAATIRGGLVEADVAEDRLQIRSYGDSQPVSPGTSIADRERNRRVAFRIESTPTIDPSGTDSSPSPTVVVTSEAAGGAQFRFERSVTIPAETSTLISIINREIGAEDVLLFRPDEAARGSDRHPLRAVRFINETGVELVPGPLSIFSRGTFVGEGLLGRVHVGDSTFVSYGLDSSTWIRSQWSSTTHPHRIVSLARGVLLVEDVRVRATRYILLVGRRSPERAFVRHGRTAGYEPRSLPPGTEETVDGLLIPLPVNAGRTSILTVTEEQPSRRRIALLDDRPTLIEAYLDASELGDESLASLRSIIETREQLRELDEQISEIREQLSDLSSRSGELRRSLLAIESQRRTTSDLRRRLTERLRGATEEREQLSTRLARIRSRRAERRAELSEALDELSIEASDEAE